MHAKGRSPIVSDENPDADCPPTPSYPPWAWLSLGATPAFALMALLTFAQSDGQASVLCGTATSSSLGGMVPMYILMSVFHVTPWLRLIESRRRHRGAA